MGLTKKDAPLTTPLSQPTTKPRGGKPSEGTSKDKRLSYNKGKNKKQK